MAEQSRSRPRPSVVNIASSDPASILKLTAILATAFRVVPLNIGFICDEDGIEPSCPSPLINSNRFYQSFEEKIKKIATSDSIMLQAGNWSGVAIWEPPGFVDPRAPDPRDPNRQLFAEWRASLKVVKGKHLANVDQTSSHNRQSREEDGSADLKDVPLRPYYHLGFLARNPDIPSVPGTMTALLEPFLQRARDEGVPAWLEASTPYAVTIYEHFGFRLVEIVTIGVGRYGSDGWPKEGGEGISGYAMIFDTHIAK